MAWLTRLRGLLRRNKLEREHEEELRFHLAMREERNLREGLPPAEARRSARLRFGNFALWRERMSEIDLLTLPQTLAQDLRFGSRILLRNPGSAAAAVFALAVGIGVNTAGFTAYRAFFARRIDARNPSQIVNLALIEGKGATQPLFSLPDYQAYRDHLHALDGVIATSLPQYLTLQASGGAVLRHDGGTGSLMAKIGLLPTVVANDETAMTMMVSENYFSVLGVNPMRGRAFAPQDGPAPAVLISENYWQKRFDRDPGIVGKTVHLNGTAFTIIGVTPHNFVGTFVAAPDFWMPLRFEPLVHPGDRWLEQRDKLCVHMRGRLAPGVTLRQARQEMSLEAGRLRPLHDPHSPLAGPLQAQVWPGSPFPIPLDQNRNLRLCVLFVMAAGVMVLVVACANVAGLQLARGTARRNELAMRLSLGASRARLIRQLITESLLLAVAAGALAFAFSWALLQVGVVAVANAFPEEYGTFVYHVAPEPAIFAFACLVSLTAGLLFGLAPALENSREAVASSLKASATLSPRRRHRTRSALVAIQVAISSVLVIAGSLLIHSALRAVHMETGYDAPHVIDVSLRYPEAAPPARNTQLALELRQRLAALPGVEGVTIARAPDDGDWRDASVTVNGETPSRQNRKAVLFYTWVQPDYFRTLGIPFLSGRGFAGPSGGAARVAVLSASAARALWPGQDPLGKTLRLGTDGSFHNPQEALPDGPAWEVIGVSRDTRGVLLDGSDSAQVYLPLPSDHLQDYSLLVRTGPDPHAVLASLPDAVAAVDPNLVATAQTLEQMLRETSPFLTPALAALVATGTGLLGLLLAAIGIYATVSYMVVLRTREVGIRIALGARRSDVLTLILAESGRAVAVGLGAGLVLAGGVAWLLRGILYGIHTIDAASFGGVTLLFVGIAALAVLVPSRRAVRVEPVVALRCE